jgi:uncharacterized repeat protein (TIGR01451 family)
MQKRMAGMLAIAALVLGAADVVQAAGTLAGTNISNIATVNYTVNAVAQPALTANADFVVDRRIDMTLTAVPVALVSVTPGTSGNLIPFTLTNTSNAPLDFSTAPANRANGTADPYGGATADGFDSTNASFADNNNSSAYEAGTDLSAIVTNLAPDASRLVFVVSTIPGGQASGTVAVVTLTATATELGGAALTQSAGADVAATVQTVFADGAGATDAARDAAFSRSSGFLVQGATVSVTKTEAIISDPINGGTNPKHIPGAIVEYTVTVTNAAGSALPATAVTLTDVLPGSVTFQPNTYAAGQGIQVGGTPRTNTNGDADGADYTGTTVTVTIASLAPAASTVITFRVAVN